MRPLIIDSFAGGGGASTGIEMALGRSPDIAINHNADALAMHEVNHPATLHLSTNIWKLGKSPSCGTTLFAAGERGRLALRRAASRGLGTAFERMEAAE